MGSAISTQGNESLRRENEFLERRLGKRRLKPSLPTEARKKAPAKEPRKEGYAEKDNSDQDALKLLADDEGVRCGKAITHVPLMNPVWEPAPKFELSGDRNWS